MREIALDLAALLAVGIILIGVAYLARPTLATRGFGLAPPEDLRAIAWLRLKGVRDVASGLVVLALMALVDSRAVGIVLLALAIIPIGDMLVVLAARGSAKSALGVHGLTAVAMILAAAPLTLNGA